MIIGLDEACRNWVYLLYSGRRQDTLFTPVPKRSEFLSIYLSGRRGGGDWIVMTFPSVPRCSPLFWKVGNCTKVMCHMYRWKGLGRHGPTLVGHTLTPMVLIWYISRMPSEHQHCIYLQSIRDYSRATSH